MGLEIDRKGCEFIRDKIKHFTLVGKKKKRKSLEFSVGTLLAVRARKGTKDNKRKEAGVSQPARKGENEGERQDSVNQNGG